jgi:hypothetical protein
MPHRGIELKITGRGMWAFRNAEIIFNEPKDLSDLERNRQAKNNRATPLRSAG